MKDLSLLPNKEGFEFIAVLKNGDIVKSKVIKDENGVHRFPEFSNSIGWLDLKIKAFRNRKTGSIDWRGNHELATIYSDNYYLKQPDLYEPIYGNIQKRNLQCYHFRSTCIQLVACSHTITTINY